MKKNLILLSGAAAMALLGTAASAQYAGNPPQYSTPAEQAQTQQLNAQGVNGTTETPAALNGEAQPQYNPQNYPNTSGPTYGTYSGYDQGQQDQAQNAPPDSQQQYNQQMQQYQNQQQDYQNKRQNYDVQRDRYEHNIRWYDQSRWAYDYPSSVAYEYDQPRLMRLDMVAEPSQQLADVPIEGPNGVWVGRIRNVETGTDGRPARIEVALNHRVSVWVSPRQLRFDPNGRVAFTNLTREDLWQMPGATVESSPM
jgi:hypothetical protein